MTPHFRRLNSDDKHEYLSLMLAAYAPIKALGIHFDAATADLARVTKHLDEHAVFALFDGQRMVASVTLRFPWGTLPGPMGLPHIGWFGTHPEYKGQNLGKRLLEWLEDHILIGELKAPAYSLGTATSHPWLREMYIKLGFQPVFERDLGKGHITLYLKKILDEERHAGWLARQPA
ncbi:GNAT family N-acetyltransferase [Rahnella sp. AA]|uniref:GNAT family N-acetyltransferase n=1 Tax=Rahnella sp. AA TaxID=2057180 RepID=UPI000C3473D7|nr:GNAT family N-acetyltransferase [Rahnella sp. AA]PKE30788.1 GNAT family N-acetyltransferase [Rahnella sp. AA]